ncbi:MAG: hypothetical protein QM692_09250 [Thermomicrobiales bacterium]
MAATTTPAAPTTPLTIEQHEARLEAGWRWLEAHEHVNRREADKKFTVWLGWVKEYQDAYTAMERGTVPHVQEAFL